MTSVPPTPEQRPQDLPTNYVLMETRRRRWLPWVLAGGVLIIAAIGAWLAMGR